MFSSYLENPTNITFDGQDDDEEIVLLLRAHPITNLSWIIPALFIFFLPLLLPAAVNAFSIPFPVLSQNLVTAMLIINYLLVLVITFEGFLYWYFNVYILTNKRIYDIDFNSLMHKNVDVAPLSSVQEANSDVGGLLGLIFNFGNVYVQTAGAKTTIDFLRVTNPHVVADKVMDEAEKIKGDGL